MKSINCKLLAAVLLATLSGNSHALIGVSTPTAHVLLISVDGLHTLDLHNFIVSHPDSAMAALAKNGIEYTNTNTVRPADSFPGLLALFTGGTPAVTGVYYDVTYDRTLSPAGSQCKRFGTAVVYDESMDNPDAGHGQPALQTSLLPLNPAGCTPVFPHAYLRVNTAFEIVRQAGGHTAWIDKHPVYEIVNGPSGAGVDDLYTPEIGANFEGVQGTQSARITASVMRTSNYDQLKVNALIREIHGYRHDGSAAAPVPTLFGLNLQAVNVGQKQAGYKNELGQPTTQLETALKHSDKMIGEIVSALREQNLLDSTLLILTAKHGNGPIDPGVLRHIDQQALTHVIELAAPGAMAHITPDQGALIWLHEADKTAQIAQALEHNRNVLGISSVLYGPTLALQFPSPLKDARSPDIIIIPQRGVIYAKVGDHKKAEHGGFLGDDTHVALLVSNPHLQGAGKIIRTPVFTTEVAPTLLAALGLDPLMLQAVAVQGTPQLPGQNWPALFKPQ